jgi:DNA-binding NtrC family response regulator
MDQPLKTFPAAIKILVVEDESIIAWDVEQSLRDRGAGLVLVAPSLRQARLILAEHSDIGLALVDIKLEDGSGADLIDDLILRGVPAIVTTGYDFGGDGRVPVVTKPYAIETLLAVAIKSVKP